MPRRILQGTVVSTKNTRTISVKVSRTFRHSLYRKTVRKSTKYAAHDPKSSCKLGQQVKIQECRPISKTKSWIVIED